MTNTQWEKQIRSAQTIVKYSKRLPQDNIKQTYPGTKRSLLDIQESDQSDIDEEPNINNRPLKRRKLSRKR